MTSDRDPTLQSLFDSARADLAGDAFVADVMARIDAARRKSILGWAFFAFVLAGVAWVVTAPVVEAVGLMSQLLPTSLIELENPDSAYRQNTFHSSQ